MLGVDATYRTSAFPSGLSGNDKLIKCQGQVMAFKRTPPSTKVPDSPEELFRQLPRRKIPDVLPHQRELMRRYTSEGLNRPDVALELPTGSGKTLVGLLIAEWRRRKFQERVVYLCPTRQLVNQVVEQADEKYGLTVVGFTGSRRTYNPEDTAAYNMANRTAVTTYQSLFNINEPLAKLREIWGLRLGA